MAGNAPWQRTLPDSNSNLFEPSYYHDPEAHHVNCANLKLISSPERVFEVVRSFNQRKKDIVRSIGFGGMLNLSRFSQVDPRFTLWLYRKVRWNHRLLAICDKINLPIKPEHIGKIMGIPYSGIEISDKCFENEDVKFAFLNSSLSFLGDESKLLESAEAHLAHEVPFSCSKEEVHNFKIAFVIFVIGRFLAPSKDTSSARSDFWGALKNPDAIHSFNWSSFVMVDTVKASRLVLWDILRKIDVSDHPWVPPHPSDNIDLGHLNLPHDVLPRVKHFNNTVVSRMIQADSVVAASSSAEPTYGRSKILRTDNICYSFHPSGSSATPNPQSFNGNEAPSPQASIDKAAESRVKFHSSGKQPVLQSTGPNQYQAKHPGVGSSDSDVPDFSHIIREYFQGQVDPALLECFRFHQAMCFKHISKFATGLKSAITKENITLVSKVVNHQRRSSGLSPIIFDLSRPAATRRAYEDMLSGGESGTEGEDNTPASNRNKHSRRFAGFESPVAKEVIAKPPPCQSPPIIPDPSNPVNFTTPKNTGRKPNLFVQPSILSPTSENTLFAGANLGLRMLAQARGVDLNERSLEAEYTNSQVPKKAVQGRGMVVPHWERFVDHPTRDVALTHTFYDWISTTTSSVLKDPWIMHDTPRYIQVTGQQLKDHFTDIQPMGYDVFDLCIRRLMQLDKSICPKGVELRWRHLIESDFSMHVLGGETPSSNVSIRHQFVSSLIDYELERCRLFLVPVLVDGLWWCYAWDLKSLTLTISDPSVGPETDVLVIQKHAGTIGLLSKWLTETVLEFYSGWYPKFQECHTVVFRYQDTPIERSKSAFFTLFFMKNFNGTNLVSSTTRNAMKNFKEYMLYEILEMKGNRVNPPSAYIHSVDD